MTSCRKCGTNDNLIKNKFKKDGLESLCKECSKILRISKHNKDIYNKWYSKNRERLIAINKENRNKRRTSPKRTPLTEEQKVLNRKESSLRKKEKRKNNPLHRLTDSIGNIIRCSLSRNGYTKKSKSVNILGCSYSEFKSYIESKFKDGMTWENYGEWHLDHIVPISWVKSENEIYTLNHYTNFQPLWAYDNLLKGNIINRNNIDINHLNQVIEKIESL